MITLIGSPKTRAFRVLWALEELQLDYTFNAAFPQSEDIRAVNPSGKLPALLVDGEVIIDSVAIVQYLADKHGGLTHPAGTIERARQDSFTQMICDDIDSSCWTMAKHSFVFPEELRNKDAVRPGIEWDMARGLAALEQRIGEGPWLTGEKFTVPDLLLTHCSNWMSVSGLELPEGKASAIIERAKARPAYVKSIGIRENS